MIEHTSISSFKRCLVRQLILTLLFLFALFWPLGSNLSACQQKENKLASVLDNRETETEIKQNETSSVERKTLLHRLTSQVAPLSGKSSVEPLTADVERADSRRSPKLKDPSNQTPRASSIQKKTVPRNIAKRRRTYSSVSQRNRVAEIDRRKGQSRVKGSRDSASTGTNQALATRRTISESPPDQVIKPNASTKSESARPITDRLEDRIQSPANTIEQSKALGALTDRVESISQRSAVYEYQSFDHASRKRNQAVKKNDSRLAHLSGIVWRSSERDSNQPGVQYNFSDRQGRAWKSNGGENGSSVKSKVLEEKQIPEPDHSAATSEQALKLVARDSSPADINYTSIDAGEVDDPKRLRPLGALRKLESIDSEAFEVPSELMSSTSPLAARTSEFGLEKSTTYKMTATSDLPHLSRIPTPVEFPIRKFEGLDDSEDFVSEEEDPSSDDEDKPTEQETQREQYRDQLRAGMETDLRHRLFRYRDGKNEEVPDTEQKQRYLSEFNGYYDSPLTFQSTRMDALGCPWSLKFGIWQSPEIYYQPLYFEQANLERYGARFPFVQPAIAGIHFFGSVVRLPYAMGSNPHWIGKYQIAHGRPGNHYCYQSERPVWSLKGGTLQALLVTGLVFALP